jgi:hypothetical protein
MSFVYYNATREALTEANRYAKAEADKLQAKLERRETELLLEVARRETKLAARREIIEKELALEASRRETEAIRLKVIEGEVKLKEMRGVSMPMPGVNGEGRVMGPSGEGRPMAMMPMPGGVMGYMPMYYQS